MFWKRALAGLVATGFVVVLSAGICFAEDAKSAPKTPAGSAHEMDPTTKAMMDAMAKLASPGPEHKVLEPLIGKWKTSTKAWMGPGDPVVSEGTAEYSWIFGGRFMEYRAKGLMWGQPFEGYELLGYDRIEKTYKAIWCDNTSTILYSIDSGSYDEATKTFTYNANWPDPTGQNKSPYKLVTKILGPDSHVFTMYQVMNGKDTPMMEMTYTRAK